jgi:hypothetical protein
MRKPKNASSAAIAINACIAYNEIIAITPGASWPA